MKLKIDLIEKLGDDSVVYGTDQNENDLYYRENRNTKLNISETVSLSIEKGKFHIFDGITKKNLI